MRPVTMVTWFDEEITPNRLASVRQNRRSGQRQRVERMAGYGPWGMSWIHNP